MPEVTYVCEICGKSHESEVNASFCELCCSYMRALQQLTADVLKYSIGSTNHVIAAQEIIKLSAEYLDARNAAERSCRRY